jgi:hypothetical protein
MQGRVAHIINDRNGHQKTVWKSIDKGSSLSGRNRIPSSVVPPQQTSINSAEIESWIVRNSLPLSQDEDFVDLVNAAVVDSGDYSDAGLKASYDEVFSENFGGYSVDSLRAALGTSQSHSVTTPEVVPNSSDSRVQNGEILDRVEHDGIVYTRLKDGNYPSDASHFRLQFSRELSDEEMTHARDLAAYAWAVDVRGETLELHPEKDSPFSFIIFGDTTKSRRNDPDSAIMDWKDTMLTYFRSGTQQKDESKRLPFIDEDLDLYLYADSVVSE